VRSGGDRRKGDRSQKAQIRGGIEELVREQGSVSALGPACREEILAQPVDVESRVRELAERAHAVEHSSGLGRAHQEGRRAVVHPDARIVRRKDGMSTPDEREGKRLDHVRDVGGAARRSQAEHTVPHRHDREVGRIARWEVCERCHGACLSRTPFGDVLEHE